MTPTPQFTPEYPRTRGPWTRPGFIAAAVLIGVVLLVGIGILLIPSDDPPRLVSPPPPAGSAAPDASSTPTEPQVALTAPPEGVTWELFRQLAVPVSATAGPREKAATAVGYAHSPSGALIAAAQIATRSGLSAGRASWEPTVTGQFLPGPDRDRLLSALRSQPESVAEPGELSQIAGFVYQSYSPDTAVIGLVRRAPNQAYFVTTLTMRWSEGDWRMAPPPGGSWLSLSRSATNLTGVVEWGAR